jgi:cell division protease FtsH
MEVEIGLPNPTVYTPDDRETVATHEAGHAAVAYLVGKNRRLEVLSIVKRKDSLGLLSHRDVDERHGNTHSEMVASLQISLGGMVAEEEFFHESGTGPSGDLKAATTTACMMVGVYGLGDSLASFLAVPDSPLASSLVGRVLDNPGAKAEVETILASAKTQTSDLIRDHRYLVEALRDALLEREELIGDEILEVLRLAETQALRSGRVVVQLSDDGADIVEPAKDINLFKAQAPREQPN